MSYIPKGRMAGKIAVVTGSTYGIGFAIAERLAREGAKVIISSRNQKNVDKAAKKLTSQGLDVKGLVCHVSHSEHRKKLVEEANKLGGIDILVSNAAVNPGKLIPILQCTESVWDKIFDVNVKSSYLLAQEVLPLIRKRPYGRIIFISSIGGYQQIKFLGAYSVSKTAVIGMTKAMAQELVKQNITVNCVAPGIIDTPFATVLTKTEDAMQESLSMIPMGRVGVPEDISGVVAFLASDDARYITGETIVAAGGMNSRL